MFVFKRRTARLRRLQAVATRTGLLLEASYVRPSLLKGEFNGRALAVTSMSKRRAAGKRRRTLVTVDVKNPEFLRLRMRRQDGTHHPFRSAEFEVGGRADAGVVAARLGVGADAVAAQEEVLRQGVVTGRDSAADALGDRLPSRQARPRMARPGPHPRIIHNFAGQGFARQGGFG